MADVAEATRKIDDKASDCGCSCGGSHKDEPGARDILDRRYAKGEITKDQYDQMKQDLGVAAPTAKQKTSCC